jgi:hypothetical protein
VYRWRVIAAVVTAIGGIMAFANGGPADSAPDRQLILIGHGSQDLIVSGTAVGNLHPGAVRRIHLSFTNPNRFPIQVIAAKGEVIAASKRGCKAKPANLEIQKYRGSLPLVLPSKSHRSGGYVEVRMPNSVSPACQLAVFSIRLTGTATKASR